MSKRKLKREIRRLNEKVAYFVDQAKYSHYNAEAFRDEAKRYRSANIRLKRACLRLYRENCELRRGSVISAYKCPACEQYSLEPAILPRDKCPYCGAIRSESKP